MMAQVIAFPQHRVSRVFTGTLPKDASPREEAIFRVRELRAQRDRHTPSERQHHVAKTLLAWWEKELASIVHADPARGISGESF